MTDQQNPVDQMMSIYGVNRHQQYGPSQIDLNDPAAIDWSTVANQYQLSPEEVQQLQVPGVAQGPSIQQRLQQLRPQMQIGPLQLSTDGHRVRGRMQF